MNVVQLLQSLPDGHIVGGYVRSIFTFEEVHDIDMATSMSASDMLAKYNSYAIGEKFGTVIVRTLGEEVEVTTMRTESGGRHPIVLPTDNIVEDLSRRDFAMNAMAINYHGDIIDPFSGRSDIENKIISSVQVPEITLHPKDGDPLRALRAVRFALDLDFMIDQDLGAAIINADLSTLSGERVYSELEKMFKKPTEALDMLDFYNILPKILPEIDEMHYCIQDPKWHPEGDVFIHTREVVEAVKEHPMVVKMAALLHDVGKPNVREGTSYHGHAKSGVKLAEDIMRWFGRPKHEVEAVKFVVENHMKMKVLSKMKVSKRRKLYDSPHFELLLTIAKADNGKRNQDVFDFIKNDKAKIVKVDIKPLLNGYDLMDLGVYGRQIGLFQQVVVEWQLEDILENKQDVHNHFDAIYNEVLER